MPAHVPTHEPFPTSVEASPPLPEVLAAMGHQCDGRCPADAELLKALWQVPPCDHPGSFGLIVVAVSAHREPVTDLAQLISEVNKCAARDRIRVRLR